MLDWWFKKSVMAYFSLIFLLYDKKKITKYIENNFEATPVPNRLPHKSRYRHSVLRNQLQG